jgi:glycosyltransferase involved in cell wall biosynthesis
MALGLPIVSTAVMGTMDILRPERGALIAEESLDDFAQKVLRVLGDEALRLRLRTEARQEIQRWSASRTAEQLAELYRELLGRQAARDAA